MIVTAATIQQRTNEQPTAHKHTHMNKQTLTQTSEVAHNDTDSASAPNSFE